MCRHQRQHNRSILFPLAAFIAVSALGSGRATAQSITQIIGPNGDGTNPLDMPWDVLPDPAGNVYVSGRRSHNIFKIEQDGTITQIMDEADVGASGLSPRGIGLDSAGNLYVSGEFDDKVFKRTAVGLITEIMTSTGDGLGNGLNGPNGLVLDSADNIYVAGEHSDNAFRISPSGMITKLIDASGAGPGQGLSGSWGIAVDSMQNAYVAGSDSDNAFRISPALLVTEIIDASGDGMGNPLDSASGIAVDTSGNVFVTGGTNFPAAVFKVATDGTITQIIDATGDGTNNMVQPLGVAVDSEGTVYVTAHLTHNVFRITPGGEIAQIMDQSGDGQGNQLTHPFGVAVDEAGVIYVTAHTTNNVFKIVLEGACCLPDDSCEQISAFDCNNQAGIYQGFRTTCPPTPPCSPFGACCLPDGSCSVTPESNCNSAGGSFQGEATACVSNFCRGACCLPIGLCLGAETADNCDAQGGVFLGFHVECGPCGACCLPDLTCRGLSEDECALLGGDYRGDLTTCPPTPPCSPFGACCLPDGSCSVTPESNCNSAGGSYQGDNTTCPPTPPCRQPGACCFLDGSCSVTSESNCNSAGGLYQGDNATCPPNPSSIIRVELQTDDIPFATSWSIRESATGNLVAERPVGSFLLANTLHVDDLCVDPCKCYDFVISDIFGDGICCNFGLGHYSVFLNDVLFGAGGQFGVSDTITSICSSATGDMNRDGLLDGRDLRIFVDAVLRSAPTAVQICYFDFDNSGTLGIDDHPGMVNALLTGRAPHSCSDCEIAMP